MLTKLSYLETLAIVLGIIAQKGGVGKTTLARLLAVVFQKLGWSVKVADFDISQATFSRWGRRRIHNGIIPEIDFQSFGSVDKALKHRPHHDLMILDGPGHATKLSLQIATNSHIQLIPTGPSRDDLEPSVELAHEVRKKGLDPKFIMFALSRTGTDKEVESAREYLSKTPYVVLDGCIPDKTSLRTAMDKGLAVNEVHTKKLRDKIEVLAQAIVDKIIEFQETHKK